MIAAVPILACAGPELVAAQTARQLPTVAAAARIVTWDEFPDDDGSIWVQQKRGQTRRYIALQSRRCDRQTSDAEDYRREA